MMTGRLGLAVAATLVASTASVVAQVGQVGTCGWERCFGAIAICEDGTTRHTTGLRTGPDAYDKARAGCPGEGAKVEIFWNSCGVVSESGHGQRAFAWDELLETAKAKSVTACEEEGDRSCYIRDWICAK